MIRLLLVAGSLSVAYLIARHLSKVPEPYFPGPTFVYTSGAADDFPWPLGI